MNYKRIYEELIERGLKRVTLEGYYEKHHIIPKCTGGSNNKENLVKLTAREHYIAHALLCKIYPEVNGLWYAFRVMCGNWNNNDQQRDYKVSSSLYEWSRINFAKAVSKQNTGNTAWNKGLKGVCGQWNEEQRKEISRRNSGAGNGMFGRKQSDKCRIVVGAIWRGKKIPLEKRAKHRKCGKEHPRYGKHWGKDYCIKVCITRCYKQLLRYNSNLINMDLWDNYKLKRSCDNVKRETILKRLGSFENMINLVNQKYQTSFKLVSQV